MSGIDIFEAEISIEIKVELYYAKLLNTIQR